MESGSDNDTDSLLLCPSPEIVEIVEPAEIASLNEKSKKSYEIAYNQFMDWRRKKKINSFSERILLAYFLDLSNKYKCSSLWTYYSMLRSTLNIHHNIQIEQYLKLRSFLKSKGQNYQPKKAKTLSPEEIQKFVNEAPDIKYLATKVALIMGIMGACRTHELYAMQVQDIQDLNKAYLVSVTNTLKVTRKFAVTDDFYQICKKYVDLRPRNASSAFFLNYQNGKCTFQRIGINKFGGMAKEVAKYLKLPNPEMFTGHCFRRSSGSDLKRHGGWKSIREGSIGNASALSINTPTQSALARETSDTSKSDPNLDFYGSPFQFTNCSDTRRAVESLPIEEISSAANQYGNGELEFHNTCKREPVDEEEPSFKVEPDGYLDESNSEQLSEGVNSSNKQINWDTNSEFEYSKKSTICESDEAELNFFRSLLPDIRKMDNKQKNKLKITILGAINDILYSEEC